MTHIQYNAQHAGDERWIEAGADAFAVHTWALIHCDEQLTDGIISRGMAERLALPVPPANASTAVDALLRLGFWSELDDGRLQINGYLTHALPADEIQATRDRWRTDKSRRRKHNNGIHDECDPTKCTAAARMSTTDTKPDTTGDTHKDSTGIPEGVHAPIPNKTIHTRPDPSEKGSGRGGRGPRRAAAASADAPTAAAHPGPYQPTVTIAGRKEQQP